jgi:outer membrane protease
MKKFCLLILFAGMVSGVFAQEAPKEKTFSLSLGTSIGLLAGQAEEIVYLGNSEDKLSQLLWDLKPLIYAGINANMDWQRPGRRWSIFADASFKAGLPMETGEMEDRDWTVLGYPDFLTHYSVSTNNTNRAFLADLDIGVSVPIFRRLFLIKPMISYSFMYFSWMASGASILYPGSDGDHGYYSSSIDVISYKQIWHIVSTGFALYGEFNDYFNIEIAFKISPLIFGFSKDDHILRNLYITDRIFGGFFLEPRLLFTFTPVDFIDLSLSVAYRHISESRGDSVYDQGPPGSSGLSVGTHSFKNIAGAGYRVFDVGLVVTFKLFR